LLLLCDILSCRRYSTLEGGFMNWRKLGDGFEYASPIRYNQEYREVEMEKETEDTESDNEFCQQWEEESDEEGKRKYTISIF
jgi:hypothetical protein